MTPFLNLIAYWVDGEILATRNPPHAPALREGRVFSFLKVLIASLHQSASSG
jgi:hypothetical protein